MPTRGAHRHLQSSKPTAPIYLPPPGVPRPQDVAAGSRGAQRRLQGGHAGRGGRAARSGAGARDWRLVWARPSSRRCRARRWCPTTIPSCIGGIGLLGTAPAIDAMEGCDTLFMVGTNFPYTKYLPDPGQCKVVQIEADPIRAGNRIATDVPMIGDAKEALIALLPRLAEPADRKFLESLQEEHG